MKGINLSPKSPSQVQGISKVRALFRQDCIPLIYFGNHIFGAITLFLKDIQATVLKVQSLIINLQSFTDRPVWRAIFFPLFKKRARTFEHSVDLNSYPNAQVESNVSTKTKWVR